MDPQIIGDNPGAEDKTQKIQTEHKTFDQMLLGRIAVCSIIDTIAHCNCYIILPAGQTSAPYIAVGASATSGQTPLGSKEISTYPPGTRAVCYFPPDKRYAIILGIVPDIVEDARFVFSDSILLRSRAGLYEDRCHHMLAAQPGTRILNASGGRPVDVVSGDWGKINDLGVCIGLGRFMTWLRASDVAKIEASFIDDMVRFFTYNQQLFTSGVEECRMDDGGAYEEVLKLAPFIWEGMGVLYQGLDAVREMSVEESALKPIDGGTGAQKERINYYGKLEPVDEAQMGVWRYQRFRGHLGSLIHDFIAAPPLTFSGEVQVERFRNPDDIYPGLGEIVRDTTGAIQIRSAKSVSLVKYALIPVPKQLEELDSKDGDGGGVTPIREEYQWGDAAKDTPAIRASQLWDFHSYLFNSYNVSGFAARKKDWKLPEEEEVADSDVWNTQESMRGFKDIEPLGMQYRDRLPTFGNVWVDPKTQARYYQSRSGIHQLDDGTVILEDGYGSQIVMSGGNIEITCQGDTILRPGRSVIAMAPNDVILRAGNSLDATAAEGDVRIKAEYNLHMLAGNGETYGGILLESRSNPGKNMPAAFREDIVLSYGVTVKTKATITLWSEEDDIFIGSGEQNVFIDAPEGTVYASADIMTTMGTRLNYMLLTPSGPEVTGDANIAFLGSKYLVTGGYLVSGGTVAALPRVDDGHFVGDGFIYGAKAHVTDSGPMFVIPTDEPPDLAGYVSSVIEAAISAVAEIATVYDDLKYNDTYGQLNSAVQEGTKFSLRSSVAGYRLSSGDFVLYETRWQQLFRLGDEVTAWYEPIVSGPNAGQDTMPYPGFDAWTEWNAFSTVDLDNFDVEEGRSVPRDELTNEGEQSEEGTLMGRYAVNLQQP